MSKIVSIATGVPLYKHKQEELFNFAEKVYCKDEAEKRKLRFLYQHSGIDHRYSVVPDYSVHASERTFFPPAADLEPFPSIECRMKIFHKHAAQLSVKTIEDCIKGKISKEEITHLITVSCTGLSAPGIDLQVMEIMNLSKNIVRTSVNFMGCYAAVHGLKLANAFCNSSKNANVVVVCTELCTLHFQKDISADNMTSSLLFADGCAAMLVRGDNSPGKGIFVQNFFSDVSFQGKKDMAWELSSKGFLMTLTGYVPDLIKEDFKGLVDKALDTAGKKIEDVTHWCIHPGGKKILESISSSMGIKNDSLRYSYDVLKDYGNMSSPTILFVLKKILSEFEQDAPAQNNMIFGAAFGPGLTMETFTASYA
ncbi:MAG: type III polyketide synthase [Ferruginibacter sp.]